MTSHVILTICMMPAKHNTQHSCYDSHFHYLWSLRYLCSLKPYLQSHGFWGIASWLYVLYDIQMQIIGRYSSCSGWWMIHLSDLMNSYGLQKFIIIDFCRIQFCTVLQKVLSLCLTQLAFGSIMVCPETFGWGLHQLTHFHLLHCLQTT